MDDALHANPFAEPRARRTHGRQLTIWLLRAMAALSLIGAGVTAIILAAGFVNTPVRPGYPPDLLNGVLVYDVNDPAPTTYGSFRETAVRLINSNDLSEVNISLGVDNRQYVPIGLPTLDQLRVVNTEGIEATYLSGGWRQDWMVLPLSNIEGDFRFAAPPGGGMLILEYRERTAEPPVRFAVGYTLEHPDAPQIEADRR